MDTVVEVAGLVADVVPLPGPPSAGIPVTEPVIVAPPA
jgi:hypothetical protein